MYGCYEYLFDNMQLQITDAYAIAHRIPLQLAASEQHMAVVLCSCMPIYDQAHSSPVIAIDYGSAIQPGKLHAYMRTQHSTVYVHCSQESQDSHL